MARIIDWYGRYGIGIKNQVWQLFNRKKHFTELETHKSTRIRNRLLNCPRTFAYGSNEPHKKNF
jgi:hypothetical protein